VKEMGAIVETSNQKRNPSSSLLLVALGRKGEG
jgi:hypothetical protein